MPYTCLGIALQSGLLPTTWYASIHNMAALKLCQFECSAQLCENPQFSSHNLSQTLGFPTGAATLLTELFWTYQWSKLHSL